MMKALDFLLMDSSEPREIFVNTLERIIYESNDLSALAESKCDQGHSFRPFIPKIARGLFNVLAKNLVVYTDDDIPAIKSAPHTVQCFSKEPSSIYRR